jgi:hypothetical protein
VWYGRIKEDDQSISGVTNRAALYLFNYYNSRLPSFLALFGFGTTADERGHYH